MALRRDDRLKTFWLALTLPAAIMLQGCGGANGQEHDEEDEEPVPIPVEVAAVGTSDVFAAYEGTTTLEAEQEADIVTKTGGIILALLVDEGDRVEANQIVARIDRERLDLQLKQARAVLGKLESEFDRMEELSERKLIARDAFDKLRFDVEQQRAAVELAELELSYTDVRTPIGGVISERMVKVGNLVELYAPLFRVDDFDPLLAIMHVPERELATLERGQKARVVVDAIPNHDFIGQLARISPVIDPRTGTFKVTVEIDEPDPRLKPGMFGRVRIVHDVRQDAVTLPREALVVEDRGSYVFVVEDGKAHRTPVRTGYVNGDRIEILDGVTPGQQVVTSGKTTIADQAVIEVVGEPSETTLAAGDSSADAL